MRARETRAFTWAVHCGMPAYAALAGVPFHRLFLEAEAIIEAYTRGYPLARDLFGPDAAFGGPTWPGISYGHANTLGARLVFPERSEVAHVPVYDSLAEGIRALEGEVDFAARGMFPFYLDLWEQLKAAFPDLAIPFHFTAEGPLTTGWILRGHDFFVELLEEPAAVRDYLRLVTESIIAYNRLIRRVNGWPEMEPAGSALADDIAAMVPPTRWPDLVLPFLECYFAGLTTGERHAHIEDLTPPHLPFLDALRLDLYDPSVSEKLTPDGIRDGCSVPFLWRLNTTHYPGLTPAGVEEWVVAAAAAGAAGVFTHPDATPEAAEKARAFARAARCVAALLQAGYPRGELSANMPAAPSEQTMH